MTARRRCRSVAARAAPLAFAAFVALVQGPASAGPVEAALPPLESFLSASDSWPVPALSDDGRFVAYKRKTASGAVLVIAPAADPGKETRRVPDPGDCIIELRWAGGGDWLALQTRPGCGFMAAPAPGFAVFALSVAEGRRKPVAGPAPFRFRLATSPERPDAVAVLRDKRDPKATTIEHTDLARDMKLTAAVPAGTTGIYLDRRLVARLISERSEDGGFVLKALQPGGDWRQVGLYGNAERDGFQVLGFSAKGQAAILIDTLGQDRAVVARLDLTTGEREILFSHPRWQPVDALLDAARERVRAVQVHGHRRRWERVDASLSQPFAALESLGDADFSILPRSADARVWLVAVETDRRPRRFGVLDVARGAFAYLPDGAGGADAGGGFAKTPIELVAGDGLRLTGYLTLPEGRQGQAVPLVQRVHGGPVLRHTWAFDPTTQWLASRGYAVLEINFRGSGGFGPAWQRLGYGQWGRGMQQDLEAAVRWAVSQGIAVADRVAIMGHSYGGYAALMGLAAFPQRYACGIGLSAPSDLASFLQTLRRFRSLARTRSQRAFVASQIARYEAELGHPETDLDAISPLAQAGRIERPILLFHGDADRAVPPAQAETLFERLADLGSAAALIRFAKEGHRIRRRSNRLAMMSLTEGFLASCLGGADQDGGRHGPANGQTTMVATRRFNEAFGQLVPAGPVTKPEED